MSSGGCGGGGVLNSIDRMAKVAAPAPSSLQIGGGGAMKASTGLRRKTPSELRVCCSTYRK